MHAKTLLKRKLNADKMGNCAHALAAKMKLKQHEQHQQQQQPRRRRPMTGLNLYHQQMWPEVRHF